MARNEDQRVLPYTFNESEACHVGSDCYVCRFGPTWLEEILSTSRQ